MNKKQLLQALAVLLVIVGVYLIAHEAKAPEESTSASSTAVSPAP